MGHAFSSAFSGAFDRVPQRGSWNALLGFVDEARDIDQKDRSTAPTSCAICYTALVENEGGTLFCPWDGIRWPEDASTWGEFPGSF